MEKTEKTEPKEAIQPEKTKRILQQEKARKLRDYLYIVVGTCVAGFGIACFITPGKISCGGVNGIATIIYHLTGFDTGLAMLCVSVPIFLAGVLSFGIAYGMKSIAGTILISLWTSFFGILTGYNGILTYTDSIDLLLSVIFGGGLVGAGVGLVMRTGANTGGTDIIAQIINKYTPLSTATGLFLADGIVLLSGVFVFGIQHALCGIVTIFISTYMVNYMILGLGTRYAKTAYIISEKHHEITKRINTELDHGATALKGIGTYTGKERTMLIAVMHNRQINQLTKIVYEEDANAFMFIQDTYEVLGEGFVPIGNVLKN
jgi:uncharacterized membrane-anchored protein YitT (DUF2179 family)